MGVTKKSILSRIDYHLTQNMFGHEHKLYNIIDRTLCG